MKLARIVTGETGETGETGSSGTLHPPKPLITNASLVHGLRVFVIVVSVIVVALLVRRMLAQRGLRLAWGIASVYILVICFQQLVSWNLPINNAGMYIIAASVLGLVFVAHEFIVWVVREERIPHDD